MGKQTEIGCDDARSITEILRRRASSDPSAVAYRFLPENGSDDLDLTYADLDARARAIGGWLQSRGCAGQPVPLIFLPGLDYIAAFYGALYCGAIAVPLNPPGSADPAARVESVLKDTGCRIVLTSDELLSRIDRLLNRGGGYGDIEFATVQSIATAPPRPWSDPGTASGSLAFLQYTSGSTASPKGVEVRHDNLLHNLDLIVRVSGLDSTSVGVSWLPHYHDMGLIGGILVPVYAGFPVALMAPASFVARPIRWLNAISRFKATVSGAPNFAYEHCIRNVKAEELQAVDLSRWRVAYCGAEPVRADTLDRFAEKFDPCGFRMQAILPCYGLAEATLMVTGGPSDGGPTSRLISQEDLKHGKIVEHVSAEAAQRVVASGELIDGLNVVIADLERCTRADPARLGEIWVAGGSVASGYWKRPEETAATFNAFLADTGEGPFLRTGDLGFIRDGMLFVAGRQKDLIIIRGQNHYPSDIEQTVEAVDPALRVGCGAAFSIEVEGEEKLVVVYEVERAATQRGDMLIERIRERVSERHDVEVHAISLIKRGTISKTTSGKIQRRRCRSEFLDGRLETVRAWRVSAVDDRLQPLPDIGDLAAMDPARRRAEIEALLREELARTFGADRSRIEAKQSFYALGIDSIGAARLCNRLGLIFEIELPLADLMNHATIEKLVEHLSLQLEAKPPDDTAGEMAQLAGWIDGLSEEEIATLLASERAASGVVSS
jgi:acyl-CoA synthetase (AMP-forming)/AMP-acid ligase II/acyl carrier protein